MKIIFPPSSYISEKPIEETDTIEYFKQEKFYIKN